MNRVIKDARLVVFMKLIIGYIAGIVLGLPISNIYEYEKIRLYYAILIAAYLLFTIYTVFMYFHFTGSVKKQVKKYQAITDFEVVDRNMGACIDINDYWILAPSQGVAICKQAFDSAKMISKHHLSIKDNEDHVHHIILPRKVDIDYVEDITTWAYSEEVEDQMIFPNSFKGPSLVINCLLLIIACLLTYVFGSTYVRTVAFVRRSYYDNIIQNEVLDQIREVSDVKISDELRKRMGYYFTYNSYINDENVVIYSDETTNSFVIENNDYYIACGVISFLDDAGSVQATDSFRCTRPYSRQTVALDGVTKNYRFDEFYGIRNYYGTYFDVRSTDYEKDGTHYLNLLKPNLDYSDAVSMMKNIYLESLTVNEPLIQVYLYNESKATKYEDANGFMNYNTDTASYYGIVDCVKKEIQMYHFVDGEKTVLETIDMSSDQIY